MMRWAEGDFLTIERQFAKQWRNALTAIDFKAMAQDVMKAIGGHWRTPKSLEDAKTKADAFTAFTEAGGPYDPKVAARLKQYVFSVGNTIEPADGFRKFRGRDPKVDALFIERGFPVK